MSLNGRVGLAAAAALLAAPLWLPFLPLVLLWLRNDRRRGRAMGLRCLNRSMARALSGYAEATMPAPPPDGWLQVALHADAYLAAVRSPRHWRTMMVLLLLEFSPCFLLRPRLSHMDLLQRASWIERRLSTTRGLLAVPALARQLVRMGYYSDPTVARQLGFRTMRERVHAGRGSRGASDARFAG